MAGGRKFAPNQIVTLPGKKIGIVLTGGKAAIIDAANLSNRFVRANSTTGFKGVSKRKSNKNFVAQIVVKGRPMHLGMFSDPKDAARAYDAAAVEYFGEFAKTNSMMGLLPTTVTEVAA